MNKVFEWLNMDWVTKWDVNNNSQDSLVSIYFYMIVKYQVKWNIIEDEGRDQLNLAKIPLLIWHKSEIVLKFWY